MKNLLTLSSNADYLAATTIPISTAPAKPTQHKNTGPRNTWPRIIRFIAMLFGRPKPIEPAPAKCARQVAGKAPGSLANLDGHLSRGHTKAAARERLAMETALHRALQRGEFALDYQPILALNSNAVVRFEVQLRWNCPQFAPVPADRFMPILEQTSLIVPVGEWLLNEALAQLQRWRLQGLDVGVAVNITPMQLSRGNLLAVLPALLARYEIPGAKLELELSESLLMADLEHSIAVLNQFRSLGITIAIDDFGTGRSCLGYLKYLPIQKLKIDKAFIRTLGSDPKDVAIIDTILTIARVLKLATVAEGVENQVQLAYLATQGCTEIQGNLLAPLSAPKSMRALLERDYAIAG